MSRVVLLALLALLGAVSAVPATASEQRPTLSDLEDELVCPSCNTTLELSNSPTAEQMRRFVRERIAAGDTKAEIKRKLVGMLGPGVLAEPPKEGFDLLAWLVPLAGAGAALAAVAVAARRWTRSPDGVASAAAGVNGRGPIEPELERRLDAELARFE